MGLNRKFVVFYSWQSDLPNSSNRGLIATALELAVGNLNDEFEVDAVVDRDTMGVPGAPDIGATIFAKIEAADVFVADVSFIGVAGDRKVSNPNVLIELGYALSCLGPDRVVLVMNTHFGDVENLPFDLKMKRATCYHSSPDDADRAKPRKSLSKALGATFAHIARTRQSSVVESETLVEKTKRLSTDQRYEIELHDFITAEVSDLLAKTSQDNFPLNTTFSHEAYIDRIQQLEELTLPLVEMVIHGVRWARSWSIKFWLDTISVLARVPNPTGPYVQVWADLAQYPALLCFYGAGLSSLIGERWDAFAALLDVKGAQETHRSNRKLIMNWPPGRIISKRHLKNDRLTPASDRILQVLEPVFRGFPMAASFENLFDRFEYFVSLNGARWVGRYCWQHARYGAEAEKWMNQLLNSPNELRPLLDAGLFAGDVVQLRKEIAALDDWMQQLRLF